ncbi:GNAT family N-acetyltransferase [Oxyplasma meridianum]|uniref:GNAT family N-acetyltransferase n=1 Tax=Oxyplasma meridianum TaxID=3073602 RepID=A0AAX4NHY1_9ARCH
MEDKVELGKLEEKDVEKVLDLVMRLKKLNQEFDSTFEVNEESREDALKLLKGIAKDSECYFAQVARSRGKIAGIIVAEFRNRVFYTPTIEARILEIYIMPEFRRSSVGQTLVDSLYAECRKRNIELVTAEFPSLNIIALNFYKKMGYREIVSVYGKQIRKQ